MQKVVDEVIKQKEAEIEELEKEEQKKKLEEGKILDNHMQKNID